MTTAVVIAAAVIAVVDLIRSRGESLTSWAVLLLALAAAGVLPR